MNIDEAKQIAEQISWPHTIRELHSIRRALTEIINRREKRRKPKKYKVAGIKLGPVSAAELVAMTARGE